MKFAVVEGLDGSGKSTQIKMLKNYFEENIISYRYLHFPQTEAPIFGELISMFLRGELGDLHTVNPYLVALMYAGDRHAQRDKMLEWLNEGHLLLLDRYVYSNVAFQCAKLDSLPEQEKLATWIHELEFNHYQLPKPTVKIFLDVPMDFTRKNLTNSRHGDERTYLMGARDIHEEDLEFQSKVRDVYLNQTGRDDSFVLLNCITSNGNMKQPAEINLEIIEILKYFHIL